MQEAARMGISFLSSRGSIDRGRYVAHGLQVYL